MRERNLKFEELEPTKNIDITLNNEFINEYGKIMKEEKHNYIPSIERYYSNQLIMILKRSKRV